MLLKITCIQGPSYFKQREKYQLQLKKMDMNIRDLKKSAQSTCDPNITLFKQSPCKSIIEELSYTIKQKEILMKEYQLFEDEWKIEQTFDEFD